MELFSDVFADGELIPSRHACDGEDLMPSLTFVNVPVEAKTLVLIMDDHDVPKHLKPDGVWDHLVVFNIDPRSAGIVEGGRAHGTYGINSSGSTDYQGPCPPDREHRYVFRLYALDCALDLAEGATKDAVLVALDQHVIAEASLMGRYIRPRTA
ncbi:MAG TPA: YbhB/YbcL family Raf kinase inhibitor-like protein [Candidatus Paceibacterota bacterium]|nr:YbhB/YbcL family Raf kinase inhibitor-like protein [Candidatus Paceibacterota bacterium]